MALSQALPGRRLCQHCVRACDGHAIIDGNTARRQHPCYRRFRAADSPNTCSDIQHDTVKTHGRGRAPNAHSRPLQTQAPHRPGGRGRAAPAHGVTRRGPFTARRNAAAVVWSLHGAMPQRWCVCGARGPRGPVRAISCHITYRFAYHTRPPCCGIARGRHLCKP